MSTDNTSITPPEPIPGDDLFPSADPGTNAASDDPLGDRIAALCAHIDAATYRLLTLLRIYDEEGRWQGCRSCAHWLSWRTGISLGPAREKVRVARRLPSLPLISTALAKGEISYSKVRALTRIATADNEAELLSFACHGTTSHVERMVQPRVQLVVHSFEGAASPADATRPPADAAGSPAETAEPPSATEPARVSAETSPVVMEAPSLVTEDGSRVSAETSSRLCCDAEVVPIARGADGSVLDVGRRRRTVGWRLRKALDARDGGCRFPGCGSRLRTHAHHITHWAHGGETAMDNLVLLCPFHHRAVHEGGWRVEMDARGVPSFFNPLGVRMPVVPEPPDIGDLLPGDTSAEPPAGDVAAASAAASAATPGAPSADASAVGSPDFGLARWHGRRDIDRSTGLTRWQGERIDWGWAMACLWEEGGGRSANDRAGSA